MLYREIQEPIVLQKEELEALWYNPNLSNEDVIRGLRKLIKEKSGFEYSQQVIRGIFKAEGMDFRQRKGIKIFPIKIVENNSEKNYELARDESSKGASASYKKL